METRKKESGRPIWYISILSSHREAIRNEVQSLKELTQKPIERWSATKIRMHIENMEIISKKLGRKPRKITKKKSNPLNHSLED